MRRGRSRDLRHSATIAGAATVLVATLLVPPIVGLADQGDFARIVGVFGYGPQAATFEDRYYGYVNVKYVRDPSFRNREWEAFTSEYLFVGAAIGLARLASGGATLDIRTLGVVHSLAFLAAVWTLLRALRLPPWNAASGVACLGVLLLICDGGYIAYFNSFYPEPASLIFFLFLLAQWVRISRAGLRRTVDAALWTLFLLLWMSAKVQNVPAGLVAAAYSLRYLQLPALKPARILVAAGAAAAFLAGGLLLASAPAAMKRAAAYNMVFLEVLPNSPAPENDIQHFGLPSTLTRYKGTGTWSPGTGYWTPEVQRAFVSGGLSNYRVLLFYFSRPGRLADLAGRRMVQSASLRPEYCGNYTRDSGYPPLAKAESLGVWSHVRERWLMRVPWLLAAVVGAGAAVLLFFRLRSHGGEHGLFQEMCVVLCAMAFFEYAAAILGDAHDVVKHFFLYNVLIDVCLIMLAALAGGWGRARALSRPAG